MSSFVFPHLLHPVYYKQQHLLDDGPNLYLQDSCFSVFQFLVVFILLHGLCVCDCRQQQYAQALAQQQKAVLSSAAPPTQQQQQLNLFLQQAIKLRWAKDEHFLAERLSDPHHAIK